MLTAEYSFLSIAEHTSAVADSVSLWNSAMFHKILRHCVDFLTLTKLWAEVMTTHCLLENCRLTLVQSIQSASDRFIFIRVITENKCQVLWTTV